MRHLTLCGPVVVLGLLSACAEVPPAGPFDGNQAGTAQAVVLTPPPIAPPPPPAPVSTTPLDSSSGVETASSRVIRSTDMAPPPLETGVVGDIPPPPATGTPDETEDDAA
ncbi:hypothetical protein EU805_14315 [Salipiger sp. IMCC34102]|uniref:hypothetical protein n=1 Tax=Salipiger sp. IMCC34102 TaxID=2510647 RepID=UPI00101C9626|nr:hypothetical protein [Salipiger sp. IMCC34102]RYH01425.1 hypothetical protein EU805_14315 [Salipiger sp. IMCC34102]